MGFAVSLFTLSLSFDIGNENHISVLNCVGHVILKSRVIEYCM